MQDKFYNWYKKSFDNLSQEPPEDVWEGISSNWDKKNLTSSSRNYSKWITGGVALMLIGSMSWVFLSKENQSILSENRKQDISVFSLNSTKNKQISNEIIDQKNIQYNSVNIHNPLIAEIKPSTQEKNNRRTLKYSHSEIFTNKKSVLLSSADEIVNIQTDYNFTFSEQKNANKEKNDDSKTAKKNVSPESELFLILQEENGLLPSNDNSLSLVNDNITIEDSLLKKYTASHLLPTGFYFGSSFILNNSWLLNNDTYDGYKASGLNDANMYFGNAFALLTGYNYSDNLSIQAEWLLYNKQGQKYKDYIEGNVINRDELLTYSQYNIIFKERNSRLIHKGNIPVAFNTILGMYYANLKSANQVIDGEKTASENYRKSNYGVIAGLEFEAYLFTHWMLTTGLRSDIGLKNIYAGNQKVPADFKKTYNSSLGINFTIAYLISSKN